MGLKDCLISAADQGEITREEAAFLADEFDRKFAQERLRMGDDVAAATARKKLEDELRARGREKRRLADLTEARRLGLKRYLQTYRDRDGKPNVYEGAMALLSHYGFRGTSSVRGKTEAIIAGAHKNLSELMFAFERRGVLGRRANRALQDDLVKEMHGEASGDATAKALAKALGDVFEDLRQRFNAGGGAIGKLDHYFPHSHDRLKVKAAGRQSWKAAIRPLLDPERMTNPLTGEPVGAAGIDAALDHVYASIVSQNRAHMQPAMRPAGLGALSRQRQDERFLVFKDAASWQDYHGAFGRGDVVQAIFNHINAMARDVAALEELGPNPAAMVEWLKQVVAHEIGKLEAGLPALAEESKLFGASQARLAEYRIGALYQTLRGRPEVVSGAANFTANVKNFLVSAQLGMTSVLAGVTDPFIARASRKLAGLPQTATTAEMVKAMSKSGRDEIIRDGVIWDEYLHVMADELRFAGPAVGSEWSRWLADRGVTWSGLKPLTTGRKLVEARAWQRHIAEISDKRFDQLDARLRAALDGFGVEARHWDIWRQSVDPAGFVTARSITERGGPVQYLDMPRGPALEGAPLSAEQRAEARALAHREAAEKLSELISSWSERAVPTGTPNARSAITGAVARGTIVGELFDYVLQYKSFGLSFTAMQLEATAEMAAARGGGRGWRTGTAYFAAMAVPMTLAGAVYIQLKYLADGREPEDMSPTNTAFWLHAGIVGGGFGLFGDFFKASENRFGQGPVEALAGPGVAFLGDALGLTLGNVKDVAGGQETRAGREAVRFLKRYTPIASSHWATRGAYNRLVLDNLQWLLDPAADKSFKAQARNARKNGAAFMIEPGAFTP